MSLPILSVGRQVFLSGYALLLLFLALSPGQALGFPAIPVAAMTFFVRVSLKSTCDIEGLFETGPRQGDGGGPGTGARAAKEQHRRRLVGQGSGRLGHEVMVPLKGPRC